MRTRIVTSKISTPVAHALLVACAWLVVSSPLPAATVAWWRFEAGPADTEVPHYADTGVFARDIPDASGNDNDLSVWNTTDTGFIFRTNRPLGVIPATGDDNSLSVQNAGAYPCMFTATGTAMQTMTPAAFTIEASFKPLDNDTWRTIVGRDSYGTYAGGLSNAALYFQITPGDAVAIKFCDVGGKWHEAVSTDGIITGFPEDPESGLWYHMAGVSDGTNLSLYLNAGWGFELVAQTDMTLSGSTNTALTRGAGGGADWTNGVWTVGRGLYAGLHDNRAIGFIDEVRISDIALSTNQFLFAYLPPEDPVTIAWWRFEEGPTNNAPVSHGGLPPGGFFPGTADSSGDNDLSVWAEGWAGYLYRTNVPPWNFSQGGIENHFSVQNSGAYSCFFTASNSFLQKWSPSAFTIEVSFMPQSGGYRTLVGRDAHDTAHDEDPNLSALYLQITPDDSVAIKFCDVSGYWHEAISTPGLITGYTGTSWGAGQWYNLAAVSDGTNLSLYLNSSSGHYLVAQTNLTLSGSPNTALTAGWGWGNDWTAGNWSVGRGLYAGVHTDRAYGFIDEVRISATALPSDRFLFWGPITNRVTNLADNGPGSLRCALANAIDGDIIDATGVSGTITLTNGELAVSKSVTILGPGFGALTVSGNNLFRVFNISSNNVVLSGMTIVNGTANFGGGILNFGTLAISDCALISNSATSDGGGIYNGRALMMTNCTLSSNSATYCGGIYNDGELTLDNCTLNANWAMDDVGGIYNGGTLTLTACTLSANKATYCGGIYNNAMATVTGCTLSGNSFARGAGIYSGGTMMLGNTILNAGAEGINIFFGSFVFSTGYNLSSDASELHKQYSDRNRIDPMLGPLQDNGGPTWTHALLPGSPAIDAGDDSLLSTMSTDQRGLPRMNGAHVDIGAYEVQAPSGPPLLAGLSCSTNGAVQFKFTNAPGVQFAVQVTTNIALPLTNWPVLPNSLVESPPGFYQFTDPLATNDAQRFYRARWAH